MRLAAFGALFAALLVVVALAVPLSFAPSPGVGGSPPQADAPPLCLALSYPQGPDARVLPASMQLLPETSTLPGWYRAIGGPDPLRLYRDAWWRPAGPDSVDIAWYHSPILRLPSRTGLATGRAIPAYVASLVAFILEAREFPVRAVRTIC